MEALYSLWGDLVGVRVSLASSVPDVRTVVAGQTLTFSASVSNTGGSGFVPTGTVTLQDTIYFVAGSSTGSSTNLLATMPLDGAGHAAVSTSALSAANHFITAVYSGDSNFSTGRVTLVEDIHAFGSTTTLASSPNPSATGQTVSLTITVAPVPPAHRFRLAW